MAFKIVYDLDITYFIWDNNRLNQNYKVNCEVMRFNDAFNPVIEVLDYILLFLWWEIWDKMFNFLCNFSLAVLSSFDFLVTNTINKYFVENGTLYLFI